MREKWIDVDYYEQIKATDAEVLQREETHQIPAITRNRYGKGAAYYLFCETEPELLGEVLDECCREKKYAVRGYTAGSNWKKNSGKPVFLCESDGKGAENRAAREWIWGAAGEKDGRYLHVAGV